MSENAFRAGVRPGGLTNSTQIRIWICYLLANAQYPPTQQELETALLKTEFVNYFELAASLSELKEEGHILLDEQNRCILSQAGKKIVTTLQNDIPPSVREHGKEALFQVQSTARQTHYYTAEVTPCENGYQVRCAMQDMQETVFSFSIYMPDHPSAEKAKEQFMQKGADLYKMVLSMLTERNQLLDCVVQGLTLS